MRAFVLDEFGIRGSLRELPDPQPAAGEVRVRVRAASLNAMDWKVAKGYLKDFVGNSFPLLLGLDGVGVVDQLGDGVDGFEVGDAVFGAAGKPFMGSGWLAELVTVPAANLVAKPPALEDVVAATLPIAGATALAAIEAAGCKAGDDLLVVGASGGVGSFTVQLASRRGARVIAVSRSENADYLKGLGAAELIDYSQGDVADGVRRLAPEGIAAIVDLVNDARGLGALVELVRDGGVVVSALGAAPAEGSAPRGIKGVNLGGGRNQERLTWLATAVERGEVQPPAIRKFSLEQAGQALEEAASGHVRGKLVVVVG